MASPEAIMPIRFMIVESPVPNIGATAALPLTTVRANSPPLTIHTLKSGLISSVLSKIPPLPFSTNSTVMRIRVDRIATDIDTIVALLTDCTTTLSVPLTAICVEHAMPSIKARTA